MKLYILLLNAALFASAAMAQSFDCDLKEYRPLEGLDARLSGGALLLRAFTHPNVVKWQN